MALVRAVDGDRARAGLLTAAAVAALGYALVAGLAVPLPVKPADLAKLFVLPAPRPPEPREKPPPLHRHRTEREGASAPPNLRSKATPVVAPTPIVPPIQPPPIVAAPIPALGVQATSGAAPVAGPGAGAGGEGTGTGSGRRGNGGGSGGTPAELISPKLRVTDLPPAVQQMLARSRDDYAVGLRFTVGVTGRLTDCAVTRSSGLPDLDVATCQAAIAKLRFTPERDARGRAIPVVFSGPQEWPVLRPGSPRDRDDDD